MEVGTLKPAVNEGITKKQSELEVVGSNPSSKSTSFAVEKYVKQSGLSEIGRLAQEMESISTTADNLMMKHLSPDQKKSIETLYKQIDKGEKMKRLLSKK